MSPGDIAVAVITFGVVLLALIGLARLAIRSDYQLSWSVRVARRNPPQPRAAQTAEGTVTEIGRGAA